MTKPRIIVLGPADLKKFQAEKGTVVINVTSQTGSWTRNFSPFFLGPCRMPGGIEAIRMENAWQYAKVYKEHVDERGEPTEEYWTWAKKGWASNYANRYPMGKGTIPEYSLWYGQKLGYIEARKRIYVPLYEEAVRKHPQYQWLITSVRHLMEDGLTVGFFDFDGYRTDKPYEEVLNAQRKMGHAFVLANMIEKELQDE